MKTKILYGKEIIKHFSNEDELLISNNFRNNQNYIISDYLKFKFERTYNKSWLIKNFFKILFFILLIWIFTPTTLFIFVGIDKIIAVTAFIFLFLWGFIIILLLYAIYYFFFNYFYKSLTIKNWFYSYLTNKYILKKTPLKDSRKKDYISYEK